MADEPIQPVQLDQYRSSAGKMASEIRRPSIRDFEADQQTLRRPQEELEGQLSAEASRTWPDHAASTFSMIM